MNRWALWFTIGGSILFLDFIAFETLGPKSTLLLALTSLMLIWGLLTGVLGLWLIGHNARRFARYMVTGSAEKDILGRRGL